MRHMSSHHVTGEPAEARSQVEANTFPVFELSSQRLVAILAQEPRLSG